MIQLTNPIICAIDNPDVAEATLLAEEVRPHVGAVKLGLEFFTANGAAGVETITRLGIPVLYTNVFWGGRSEIKPSEISPIVFREWHEKWANVPGPVV